MSDDIAFMSDWFFALIMKAVNMERWKERTVLPLSEICFKTITQNAHIFKVKRNGVSLLEIIPKPLARKFFQFIGTALTERQKFTSKVDFDFLMPLVNDSFTKFDFDIVTQLVAPTEQPFKNVQIACVLLHHIQRNCTKIEWLRMYWPSQMQYFFPWESVVQWRELKFLSIKDFICEPKTLRLILKNHPNLRGLEITIYYNEEESSECVGYLTAMKNLQHLSLQITGKNNSSQITRYNPHTITALIANVAAKTPNLTNFHFCHNNLTHNIWNGFLEKFSSLEQNAKRKLHIVELVLHELECEWPKNLTVGKLKILGLVFVSTSALEKMRSICTEKLIAVELKNVQDQDVYRSLEIFGPKLEQLGLKFRLAQAMTRNLNLYRVIEMCPNLRKLFVDECSTLNRPADCTLSAESFSRMETFALYRTKYENIIYVYRKENCELLKMFLTGSQKLNNRVHIFVAEMIPSVLQTIREDHECLKDIKEVHFDVEFPESETQQVMQIAKILMLRSPFLRRIKIWYRYTSFEAYLERWFLRMTEALDVSLEYEPIYMRPLEYEVFSEI
ncbi:uncharacterized protein LOC132195084 [Neocloeon triangulifer]|uniref:uncharacterized protein LOC132195084 n=1 Tax=Neocloeon triangulifer TaxID=2078957 RepID=UPI00286F6CCB|nr:uncharacterized protein LOC132195084 [Neocloeon triangulifer]XP_059472808.1 uncharacterized protein LOC132195084 [Neocloeon triangulifer]